MHGKTEVVALGAPHVVHRPNRAMRNSCRQAWLVTRGARRVIASEARSAHGDAQLINVGTLFERVDAFADWYFAIRAGNDLVPTQRAALSRPINHQHRDAALQAAMSLHKPHLVLDGIKPAHADQRRQFVAGKRRANEIAADRLARLIGNLDDLAGRIEVTDEFVRAAFHLLESGKPARIVRFKMEFRLPVIICRAQEAVHRGADVTGLFFGEPAIPIAVGNPHPLGVPAFQITRNHPRSRLHYLADAAAPFLGFAKAATELISQPGMFRPVMPAERLVMRTAVSGDLLDCALADAGIRRRPPTYAIFTIVGRSMVR